MGKKGLILSDAQIKQKIKRIAYEIYENNPQEEEIILAGIHEQGYRLAELIQDGLQAITPMKITLIGITLDKFAPTQSEISVSCDVGKLADKCIILVDDVMNTGKTMAYSLKPFLNVKIKKIETAVLVNRSHTQFPVSVQYTGYQLSTTMNEHVDVQLEKDQKEVYLQ